VESADVPPLYVYHKRNSWVLLLAALLFLSFGIVGSLFVYRMVNPEQNRTYWYCHVPYDSSPESLSSSYTSDQRMFDEEFDINVDLNYAKIRVPDFSGGRTGRFIHDFNSVIFFC
jgi:hypothetical protein